MSRNPPRDEVRRRPRRRIPSFSWSRPLRSAAASHGLSSSSQIRDSRSRGSRASPRARGSSRRRRQPRNRGGGSNDGKPRRSRSSFPFSPRCLVIFDCTGAVSMSNPRTGRLLDKEGGHRSNPYRRYRSMVQVSDLSCIFTGVHLIDEMGFDPKKCWRFQIPYESLWFDCDEDRNFGSAYDARHGVFYGGSAGDTISVWSRSPSRSDDPKWQCKETTLRHRLEKIDALAVLPSREGILFSAADDALKMWDVEKESVLSETTGHRSVKFECQRALPKEGLILTGADQSAALLWDPRDLAQGPVIKIPVSEGRVVYCACDRPRKRQVLLGSDCSIVGVFDLRENGRALTTINSHWARKRIGSQGVVGITDLISPDVVVITTSYDTMHRPECALNAHNAKGARIWRTRHPRGVHCVPIQSPMSSFVDWSETLWDSPEDAPWRSDFAAFYSVLEVVLVVRVVFDGSIANNVVVSRALL